MRLLPCFLVWAFVVSERIAGEEGEDEHSLLAFKVGEHESHAGGIEETQGNAESSVTMEVLPKVISVQQWNGNTPEWLHVVNIPAKRWSLPSKRFYINLVEDNYFSMDCDGSMSGYKRTWQKVRIDPIRMLFDFGDMKFSTCNTDGPRSCQWGCTWYFGSMWNSSDNKMDFRDAPVATSGYTGLDCKSQICAPKTNLNVGLQPQDQIVHIVNQSMWSEAFTRLPCDSACLKANGARKDRRTGQMIFYAHDPVPQRDHFPDQDGRLEASKLPPAGWISPDGFDWGDPRGSAQGGGSIRHPHDEQRPFGGQRPLHGGPQP